MNLLDLKSVEALAMLFELIALDQAADSYRDEEDTEVDAQDDQLGVMSCLTSVVRINLCALPFILELYFDATTRVIAIVICFAHVSKKLRLA